MNTVAARLIFANGKKSLKTAGIDTANTKITQSFIRLEQGIVAGKTVYQFPMLTNQTQLGIFNTENRLNLQDSFVVSTLGLFLASPSSATDAAFKLLTRPSADEFATAGAAAAAQVIYNGFLSLAVNNNILIPSWDTARHLKTPRTQYTAATNSPVDEFDGSIDGYYPVEPNITLVGSKNSVLQLTLPAAVATLEANSRIVIIIRGLLAQNTTVVS